MAPSRPLIVAHVMSKFTHLVPSVEGLAGASVAPKPASIREPIARAKVAKPVNRVTALQRPATRAYAKKVKEEKPAQKPEEVNPIQCRRTITVTLAAPSPPPALQPSALAAPAAPVETETELESLMTIGREQVEKELKSRIKEEKQKTAYRKYQNYLAGLKGLEEDLKVLKMDNHMDEDTVMELAEDFRENTMELTRLFEKYAEDLGITIFDIRKLGEAW